MFYFLLVAAYCLVVVFLGIRLACNTAAPAVAPISVQHDVAANSGYQRRITLGSPPDW